MITLKTLASATEQEVFNQVKNHLLTQNCRSQRNGTCLYRGPDGTKCAAGCLIGDDEYLPKMDTDNVTWVGLIPRGLVPTDAHKDLIVELQVIHDYGGVEKWPFKLKELAEKRGLVWE